MLRGKAILRGACGKVNLDLGLVFWVAFRPHERVGIQNETDVSPAQQAPDQQAWVPRPDGHTVGARDIVTSAEEGSQGADRSLAEQARRLLTPTERLPRARRLGKASQIRRLLQEGRRRRMDHLDVIWTDNVAGHPRIGLIVPKYQSTGVARNRLRRQVREVLRLEIQPALPAWDVLVRTRREAYVASRSVLQAEMRQWGVEVGLRTIE